MTDHNIISLNIDLVKVLELFISLHLGLSVVNLMAILIVLIGNLVLPINVVLDLLKMSILISHERSHDGIYLPERLLSVLQHEYLLGIPLIKHSIRSASLVPSMLVIETTFMIMIDGVCRC